MRIFHLHRTYRSLRRYRQIISTFVKYGFDDVVERLRVEYFLPLRRKFRKKTALKDLERLSRPERIRMVFEELGPTFIKLGQLLSVRADILPRPYVTEFAKLLDDVPCFPTDEAVAIIESELGKPLAECFSRFDRTPISAASIAQVHCATTLAGEDVVIKIRRPGIKQTIEEDIHILLDLAYLAERYLDEGKFFNPVGLVEEFAQTIRKELDFVREGQNIDRFRRNFANDPGIYIPTVIWNLSTEQVLTMERIHGIKLSHLSPDQLTLPERRKLAIRAARATLKEIFEFGFFHADPHPGNVFITDDLRIAPIDFGIVGSVDDQTKDALASLLRGIIDKDMDTVLRGIYNLGRLDYDFDPQGLRRDLYEFIDRYHGLPLHQLKPGVVIPEMLEVLRRHRVQIPTELAFMGKTLLIQNSVGQEFYPDFDIFSLARPYVRRLLMRRFRPRQQAHDLFRIYEDSLDLLKSLPYELKTLITKTRRGHTSIRMEHHGLEYLIQEMDRSSNRIAFALIVAALIIGSSIILQLDKGPFVIGFSVLGIVGYMLAGILGIWLVVSILRSGKL